MILRSKNKSGEQSDLKLALLSDELTYSCLDLECGAFSVSPKDYWIQLKYRKPDFLLIESAWLGKNGRWKFKIANYLDHPKRNNRQLIKLVNYAKERGIPTVFWNKEDGVHFDRFIDSAKHFDHIFTVDANCIPRYREIVPASTSVNVLPFAVQPRIHYYKEFSPKLNKANFVGSYSHHIHNERRTRQDILLKAANDVLGLDVYDRNSNRKAEHYRFPKGDKTEVCSAVAYSQTADIYWDHLVSLNVNTVTDSPTMYSRRLVEIIACGGIAVTTPAQSVDNLFSEYCFVVDCYEEAHALFSRLNQGPSANDLERARAGADYVSREHTWERRLKDIREVVGI